MFPIGTRLRLSAKGLAHFNAKQRPSPFNAAARATVVGQAKQPGLVRIRRDGSKTVENYAATFWELDQ